jgi:hypothetical protein
MDRRVIDDANANRIPGAAIRNKLVADGNRAMEAKRLKSLSSGPNTSDGRTITLSGNSLSTAASPAALVRA